MSFRLTKGVVFNLIAGDDSLCVHVSVSNAIAADDDESTEIPLYLVVSQKELLTPENPPIASYRDGSAKTAKHDSSNTHINDIFHVFIIHLRLFANTYRCPETEAKTRLRSSIPVTVAVDIASTPRDRGFIRPSTPCASNIMSSRRRFKTFGIDFNILIFE